MLLSYRGIECRSRVIDSKNWTPRLVLSRVMLPALRRVYYTHGRESDRLSSDAVVGVLPYVHGRFKNDVNC